MKGRIVKKRLLTVTKATIHKLSLKPNEIAILTMSPYDGGDPHQLIENLSYIVPPEMARRMMVWCGDIKLSVISAEESQETAPDEWVYTREKK